MANLTYEELLLKHIAARINDPQLVPPNLPDFARRLNELTGTKDYDAGLTDNLTRQIGSAYHEVKAPIREVGENIGLEFNKLIQPSEDWANVAPDVGAGIMNVIPDLLVATAGMRAKIPVPATLAGLGALETYGETGSALQAGVTGAFTMGSFGVANIARNAFLKKIGAPTLAEASKLATSAGARAANALKTVVATQGAEAAEQTGKILAPATFKHWLATHVVAEGALEGTSEIGNSINRVLQSKVDTGEYQFGEAIPTPQQLVTTILSETPFMATDVVLHGRRPISEEAKAIMENSKKNFKTTFKELTKSLGVDASPEDINAAFNRALKRAGMDVEGAVLNSVNKEAYLDPEYADIVFEESKRAKQAESDRRRDMQLTLGLTGEAVDISLLGEGEQKTYADLMQRRNQLDDAEAEQLANLQESAKVRGDIDPELQKRVAEISGSPMERGTTASKRNIIERFQRFQWLREHDTNKAKANKEAGNQAGLIRAALNKELEKGPMDKDEDNVKQQQVIADLQAQLVQYEENPNDTRRAETMRQIVEMEDQGRYDEAEAFYQSLDVTDVDNSTETGLRSSYDAVLPEQTAAAQRAALVYDPTKRFPNRKLGDEKKVDWNDPAEVRAFERYVYDAMSRAKTDVERNRAGEVQVSAHPTMEEAQINAAVLNEGTDAESGIRYGVPKRPNSRGEYVVKKYSNYRVTELIADWRQELEAGGKLDFEDYLHKLESGELFQGPITAKDTFQAHMDKIDKLVNTPSQREALYHALSTNILSAVKNLSPDTITRVTGARKNDKNIIGRRLVRYLEYLHQGGKIDLVVSKTPKREVVGVFHTERDAQLYMEKIKDDLLGAKTSLALETRDETASDGAVLGKLYAVTKAAKEGGEIKSVRARSEKLAVGQKTQLQKFNEFLGDLGFADASDLNNRKNSKMNFFEQMHALGLHVGTMFQNPNDMFTRPPGEFGMDVGVIEGKGGKWAAYGQNAYVPNTKKLTYAYTTRNGQRKLFTHEGKGSPLLNLFAKLRQEQGSVEASVIGDMLMGMDDRDVPADLKAAIQVLTKRAGAQQVKFGVAISKNSYGEWDPTVRGWYNHIQGKLQGVGAMLSPWYRDPSNGRITWLKPEQMAAVFVHELVHANTSIGLWQDRAFRQEVEVLHDYIKQKYNEERKMAETVNLPFQSLLGLEDGPHAVDEFFAEMWTNPALRKFVWSLPDDPTLGPLPERSIKQLNIFHRFWSTMKKWMQKTLGHEAGTIAERVQQMQERAIMIQDSLGQLHQEGGDIYANLAKAIFGKDDIIVSRPALPVPKGEGIKNAIGGGGGNEIIPQDGGKLENNRPAPGIPGIPTDLETGQPKELFFEKGKEVDPLTKFSEQKALPDVEESASQILESRTNIDVSKVRRALQYGATEWLDNEDGSWTFKTQDGKSSFLGHWGLSEGREFTFVDGVITVKPEGQKELANVLSNEAYRQASKDVFEQLPQFVSGFQTIQQVYEQAGYTRNKSQQMATVFARYLSAWHTPDKFTVSLTDYPARAIASKADAAIALNTGAHAFGPTPHNPEQMAKYVKDSILHETFHLADVAGLSDLTQLAAKLNVEERFTLMQAVVESWGEKDYKDYSNFRNGVLQPTEFSAEFASKMYQGLVGKPNPSVIIREYLMNTSDAVQFWLSDQIKTQYDIFSNMVDAIPVISTQFGAQVGLAAGFTKSMMRPVKEVEALTTKALQMRWLYPDNFYAAVDLVNKRINEETSLDMQAVVANTDPMVLQSQVPAGMEIRETLGLLPNHKVGWWNKLLTRFNLLAQQYPDLKPVWNGIDVANRMAHEATVRIQSILLGRTAANNVDDKGIIKDLGAFKRSAEMQRAFSHVALEMQIIGEKGVALTPDQRQQLLERYISSPEQRRIINHVIQATLEQNKVVATHIMKGHAQASQLIFAIAARKYLRGALNVEQAREFAKDTFAMYEASISGRVAEAQMLQQKISQMIPNQKALVDLMQTAQSMFASYDENGKLSGGLLHEREFLKDRGDWWMTERRFGDYGLYYRDEKGKMTSMWFQRIVDRDKFAIGKRDVRLVDNDGDNKSLGLNTGLLERLRQADSRQMERLRDALGEDTLNELGLNIDLESDLRAAMLAGDVSNTSIRRKHSSGSQYLSMYDNQQIYHGAAINALKNKQMKLETALALTNPVFDQQPDLKRLATQHLSNVLKPDTEWGRRIQTANFTYFLIGNISNMILEPFQQLMSLAPALTENGAGIVGSYKMLMKANKDVISHRTNKQNRYKDLGLEEAVGMARAQGIIDAGLLTELDYHPDLNYINSVRTLSGKGDYTLFDMLKNRVYQVSNTMKHIYGLAPSYNSEVAFVSAYRQEFAKSKNIKAAFEYAATITRQSMFGAGKIARPVGVFKMGRTAAQAMYSLQAYGTSMMTLMGYYAKQSFRPKGLTDAQAIQVKKAAVQMWGTQFALAGALGMPFVSGFIATLGQFFPEINWEQEVREFLIGWIPEDNAMGGFMGDFVAKGLPSATQFGPDMGSRFALGGTLGISPYTGIGVENLIGPTASLATNVVRAGQAAAKGQPMRAAHDVLPKGFQRMIDAVTQGKEYRNRHNELLIDDMTPVEQAVRAAGFVPNRAARLEDARRLSRDTQEAKKLATRQDVERWASQWIKGEHDGVRQAVIQREQDTKGAEQAKDLIRAIANSVEKQTMLQDPREYGTRRNVAEADSLLRLMQQGGQTLPTQFQRLQKKDEVQRSLGGQPAMTRERMGRSLAVDRIMQSNPALSRARAMMMLEQMGG